ncbi:6-pyruvoyl trahydropterin synthase family protein [Flaviflagellibacter deserti]|uniref:6-carboxy-5,6,7,8-tetrahydropterin synthase n=1 Tax=Flaviflagellibacter deserti TaxID=2267266 RepID=A0ABV9YYJ5_9HYPH
MFAVEVRDHIMIAHSLPSPVFGPAQGLHGATYVVDAAFFTEDLDDDGLVVDIGLATTALADVLDLYRYKNLDEIADFEGRITTTEFMAKVVSDALKAKIVAGELGPVGRIKKLRVMLHESHAARAWFETDL